MIRLANVLIVEDRQDRAEVLRERLWHGGYHSSWARNVSEADLLARQDQPDLVLLGQSPDGDILSSAEMLKTLPTLDDTPMVLVAGKDTGHLEMEALNTGIDDVVEPDCGDEELFSRLRPLVRLSTMRTELRLRTHVAQALGLSVSKRTEEGPARPAILLVGDTAEKYAPLLSAHADTTATSDLYEAENLLGQRNYDAALLAFSVEPTVLLDFCSQVRNNPRLFNLPLVLLRADAPQEAYRRGVTRVLAADPDDARLTAVVMSLVRRQRLRWSIRTVLQETLGEHTRDEAAGAYSRRFLDFYLPERLEMAKLRHRHLAVVLFSAPSIERVRSEFGQDAAAHLTRQMGQWITGLLRTEDIVASYAENEFCAILPDSTLDEAQIAMHRIAGVLTCTDFAVRDVYQPVKLWVQVGGSDVRAGDSVETLLSRVRGTLA